VRHHTKDKGDLAVLKVMASLGEQDFLILNPLTEHSPFDLVIYKNGTFKRVQVKYRKEKNGVITVDLRSSWADKNGSHTLPFKREEVDLIAIYCPQTDTCYYVDVNQCLSGIALRTQLPKNNQVAGIRLAKDFVKVA